MKSAGTASLMRRFCLRLVVALALLYLLLLMPAPELPVPVGANQAPFAWNRDAFWWSLEIQFKEARSIRTGNWRNWRERAKR